MSLIKLIICKHCYEILSTENEITFQSNEHNILSLKSIPYNILQNDKNNQELISSFEIYDNYCVYSELKCSSCSIPLGKKYLTMNEYLLKNSINFSIDLKRILLKEYFLKENPENDIIENNNSNENLQIVIFNAVSFQKGLCVLSNFFHSNYELQKNFMKKLLARIKKIENDISLLINFLSLNKI